MAMRMQCLHIFTVYVFFCMTYIYFFGTPNKWRIQISQVVDSPIKHHQQIKDDWVNSILDFSIKYMAQVNLWDFMGI